MIYALRILDWNYPSLKTKNYNQYTVLSINHTIKKLFTCLIMQLVCFIETAYMIVLYTFDLRIKSQTRNRSHTEIFLNNYLQIYHAIYLTTMK